MQIVDIADSADPRATGHVPSHVDTFSGEGAQVVSVSTPMEEQDLDLLDIRHEFKADGRR